MSSLWGMGSSVDCRRVDLWASDPDSDTSSDSSRDEMQCCRSTITPREQPAAAAVSEGPTPVQKDPRERILRAFQQIITSPEYLKDPIEYVKTMLAEATNDPDYEFVFPEFGVLNMLREKHGL